MVDLLEDDTAGGDETSSSSSSTGPAITIQSASGGEWQLSLEDLQMILLVVQTAMLVSLVVAEVRR